MAVPFRASPPSITAPVRAGRSASVRGSLLKPRTSGGSGNPRHANGDGRGDHSQQNEKPLSFDMEHLSDGNKALLGGMPQWVFNKATRQDYARAASAYASHSQPGSQNGNYSKDEEAVRDSARKHLKFRA